MHYYFDKERVVNSDIKAKYKSFYNKMRNLITELAY